MAKKKIVLCGSMEDLKKFREVQKKHKDCIFFPTEDYLKRINETVRTVDAPVPNKTRLALILEHLSYLREADEVWILNEKWLQKEGWTDKAPCEYVGIGTALNIGYALALNKKIKWLHRPRDPTLVAIFEGCPSKDAEPEYERSIPCMHETENGYKCPKCGSSEISTVPYCVCESWQCKKCNADGCQPYRWTTGDQCKNCWRKDQMKRLKL